MARRALLGANDETVGNMWERVCGLKGYGVVYAQTPEEMVENAARSQDFSRYIMDVNFKSGTDIWPGRGVWNMVRTRAEAGEDVKFMAVSGDDRVVDAAREEGIPVMRKTDFTVQQIIEFLS